jgi:hypothetical protein
MRRPTKLTHDLQGLNASMEEHGFNGDGFGYLRNATWWAGITTSERRPDRLKGALADWKQW